MCAESMIECVEIKKYFFCQVFIVIARTASMEVTVTILRLCTAFHFDRTVTQKCLIIQTTLLLLGYWNGNLWLLILDSVVEIMI